MMWSQVCKETRTLVKEIETPLDYDESAEVKRLGWKVPLDPRNDAAKSFVIRRNREMSLQNQFSAKGAL